MQTNMNITVSNDFAQMCQYSQQTPEEVLQSFADQVSYPLFFTTKDRNEKLATYFFIQLIQSPEFKGQINESLEEHYFMQMAAAINESFAQHPGDDEKAIAIARKIMEQWAKSAVAERSRYLTDDL